MTYGGLFILIGSQFVACSLNAMATKTLFDVVSERVCSDELLYQKVKENCFVREVLEKKYAQLLQDYVRIHASDLWKLFAEQVDLSGAHERTVTVSAFLSPNCAVTGCAGGRLCFWDFTKSTAPLFFAQGHDDGILALVVMPQDSDKNPVFVTGSKDGTVRLWELQEQTLVLKWVSGIEGEISRITCNNAGTCVAIAVKAQQGGMLWDFVCLVKAATGEQTQAFSTVFPCALCFSEDDSKLIVVSFGGTREIDVATAVTRITVTGKPESICAAFSQGELCIIGRGVLRRGNYEQPLSVATYKTLCVGAYSGSAWEVITHGGSYNTGHVIVNRRDTLLVPFPGFVKTTAIMGGFILFGGKDGALVLVRLSTLLDTLTLQQAQALFSYGLTPDEAKEALQFMQQFLAASKLPDGELMQEHLRRLSRGIIPFIERAYRINLPRAPEERTSSRRVHALTEHELIFEQFPRANRSFASPESVKRK